MPKKESGAAKHEEKEKCQKSEKSKQPNLTRKELAEILAKHISYPHGTCSEIVDSFFNTLKQGMLEGDNVKLVHFGTFTVRNKSPRRGRNPRTGETITIKKRQSISFRPSRKLREQINE